MNLNDYSQYDGKCVGVVNVENVVVDNGAQKIFSKLCYNHPDNEIFITSFYDSEKTIIVNGNLYD